jgi:hypothetical protein
MVKVVKQAENLGPEYLNGNDPVRIVAIASGLRTCFERVEMLCLGEMKLVLE